MIDKEYFGKIKKFLRNRERIYFRGYEIIPNVSINGEWIIPRNRIWYIGEDSLDIIYVRDKEGIPKELINPVLTYKKINVTEFFSCLEKYANKKRKRVHVGVGGQLYMLEPIGFATYDNFINVYWRALAKFNVEEFDSWKSHVVIEAEKVGLKIRQQFTNESGNLLSKIYILTHYNKRKEAYEILKRLKCLANGGYSICGKKYHIKCSECKNPVIISNLR